MFDRKSDYALNKRDPDAIVCKSATGVHIRLTRADFSSDAEFERWKHWSDEDYHDTEKTEHIYQDRTLSLERLSELSIAVLSAETELMDQFDQEERARLCSLLAEGLEACLTSTQRRRLWLYCVEGLTIEEIAKREKVNIRVCPGGSSPPKKFSKNFWKSGCITAEKPAISEERSFSPVTDAHN